VPVDILITVFSLCGANTQQEKGIGYILSLHLPGTPTNALHLMCALWQFVHAMFCESWPCVLIERRTRLSAFKSLSEGAVRILGVLVPSRDMSFLVAFALRSGWSLPAASPHYLAGFVHCTFVLPNTLTKYVLVRDL